MYPESLGPDELQELFASLGLIESTAEVAGRRNATLLLHPAHLHAHVLSLNDYHHAKRLQGFLDAIAYLLRHALLYLEAMREAVHDASYLAQACDLSVRDVRHMNLSVEWQHVMLAKRIEIDVANDDHLAIILVELRRVEYRHRVLLIAASQESHCPSYAFRRLEQAFALSVFTEKIEDSADVFRYLLLSRSQFVLILFFHA